jgi:hypothetical protein
MNEQVAFSLCCGCFLMACGGRSHNRMISGQDSIQASSKREVTAPPFQDPDTSLVSLKAFKNVALADVVSQTWKFEDADQPHWNEIFWDTARDTRQYPGLALFPDHNVTENPRCRIRVGKWSLNKATRELVLQLSGGFREVYGIRQVALKEMELGRQEGDGMAVIRLSAEAVVHRRPFEDPFYPLNNRWRLRPRAPETKEQIRSRIRECVHFYSLFFLDNHQRRQTDISFSGLPSCFVWYNGGIGMQEKGDLDQKWIACFYSADQAMSAYDMLASELEKHELKWPEHPKSWVLQTGQVLDQLYHKL